MERKEVYVKYPRGYGRLLYPEACPDYTRHHITYHRKTIDIICDKMREICERIKQNSITELNLSDSYHFDHEKKKGFLYDRDIILKEIDGSESGYDSDGDGTLSLYGDTYITITIYSVESLTPINAVLQSNTSLTKLDLSGNKIYFLEGLCNSLQKNSSLTELNLSGNEISSVKCFCDVLKYNSTLTSLNLSDNNIQSLNTMFKGLKRNSSLTELDLSYNRITRISFNDDILESNFSLTSLDLSDNCINDTDFFCLSNQLKKNSTLTHLNLKNNRISISQPNLFI